MAGGQILWRRRAGPTITIAWIRTRAVRMVTAALRIAAGTEIICPPKKKLRAGIARGLSLADSLARRGRGFRAGPGVTAYPWNAPATPFRRIVPFDRGGESGPIPLNSPP